MVVVKFIPDTNTSSTDKPIYKTGPVVLGERKNLWKIKVNNKRSDKLGRMCRNFRKLFRL